MVARAALTGVLLLVAFATRAEFDNGTPFQPAHSELWGRPARIVAPQFPPAALAAGHSGYVELKLRIGPLGEARDVTYEPDSPESASFVDAVKAVLPYWSFYVPQADDCMPSTDQVVMRVWFEVESGKPHISVEPKTIFPRPDEGKMKVLERVDPYFPKKMIVEGRHANAYARVEVDRHGNVTDVYVRTYPEKLADTVGKSVVSSLKQWKFSPLADGEPSRTRTSCQWVLFRLRD